MVSNTYSCKYKLQSNIRRTCALSGTLPGLQFGATNSGTARITREHFSYPRADATHAYACVPSFLLLLLFLSLLLLLFSREEEPVRAVNQSPRDGGANARKSHGGLGLMAVRFAC